MVLPLVGIAAGVAARAVAKKVASNAVKSAATKKLVKEAAKKKALATPKSNVKVKPAAKQKPNKPNEAKAFAKSNDSMGRAYNKALKEYNSMPEAGRFGSAAEAQANARDAAFAAPMARKASIAIKKLSDAEKRKATTPTRMPAKPARETVKINSAKPTRMPPRKKSAAQLRPKKK